MIVRLSFRPCRLTVGRHRIHHGLLGLVLLLHDCRDWKVWIRDALKSS